MNETENPPVAPRGFWALIVTQFQGAFSDNTLKWLTTYLITQVVTVAEERDRLMTVVTVLFTLPFILFSMTGGFLADRFSKRKVMLRVKMFEVFVMSLALFQPCLAPTLPDHFLRVSHGLAQRHLRSLEIWDSAGIVAGKKVVLG